MESGCSSFSALFCSARKPQRQQMGRPILSQFLTLSNSSPLFTTASVYFLRYSQFVFVFFLEYLLFCWGIKNAFPLFDDCWTVSECWTGLVEGTQACSSRVQLGFFPILVKRFGLFVMWRSRSPPFQKRLPVPPSNYERFLKLFLEFLMLNSSLTNFPKFKFLLNSGFFPPRLNIVFLGVVESKTYHLSMMIYGLINVFVTTPFVDNCTLWFSCLA